MSSVVGGATLMAHFGGPQTEPRWPRWAFGLSRGRSLPFLLVRGDPAPFFPEKKRGAPILAADKKAMLARHQLTQRAQQVKEGREHFLAGRGEATKNKRGQGKTLSSTIKTPDGTCRPLKNQRAEILVEIGQGLREVKEQVSFIRRGTWAQGKR